MKNNLISIGEMARINRTTINALRLYDSMGLLTPCYTNPETGYRYYDIRQNARLDMIKYMKELGMELREIKLVMDSEDLLKIEEILIRKREQIINEVEELKIKCDGIDRTIASIERYQRSPRKGTMTLEYIPERRIYSMETDINFYDYDIDTYENILKEFRDKMFFENIPQIYYCNVGTVLEKEDFKNQNYVSHKMFVFVDSHFPLIRDTELIPSWMYACIYLDDFDKEKEYGRRLLRHCKEMGYEVAGNYLCEVLTEFNVFDCEKRSMFLRLQVPVNFNDGI